MKKINVKKRIAKESRREEENNWTEWLNKLYYRINIILMWSYFRFQLFYLKISYFRFSAHDASKGAVVGIDFSTDNKYIRTFSSHPSSFAADKVDVNIFNIQVSSFLSLFLSLSLFPSFSLSFFLSFFRSFFLSFFLSFFFSFSNSNIRNW